MESSVIDMKNFTDRLIKAMQEKKSHVILGLDPRLIDPTGKGNEIPKFVRERASRCYGDSPEAARDAIIDFNTTLIDHMADIAVAAKPNRAFYESLGTPGIEAFDRTVEYAGEQDLLVIGDSKRNDIGSTAEAYANGWLGEVTLLSGRGISTIDVDAMTVNPYTGSDGIGPFVKACNKYGKGIFALCKTSNPSAAEFQDRLVLMNEDDMEIVEMLKKAGLSLKELPAMKSTRKKNVMPNYVLMARLIDKWGNEPELKGNNGYSCVGAVVGAKHVKEAKVLRLVMPNTFLLVPGYGFQGGGDDDIPNFVDENGLGAGVNASRSLMFAYSKLDGYKDHPERYGDATRGAGIKMRDGIAEALKRANKWSFS